MQRRILLVDDENNITRYIEGRLGTDSYRYDSFKTANNAYWFFKLNRESIDLVIIDLTMKGRTGNELADRLCRMKPGIPIVLIAGLLETGDQFCPDIKVIYKPVSGDEVLNSLSDFIGQ